MLPTRAATQTVGELPRVLPRRDSTASIGDDGMALPLPSAPSFCLAEPEESAPGLMPRAATLRRHEELLPPPLPPRDSDAAAPKLLPRAPTLRR